MWEPDRLRGALDLLEIAADPVLAAERAGLVWADLEQEDRDGLAGVHLAALELAIERQVRAAERGDQAAADWVERWTITVPPPPKKRKPRRPVLAA